MEYLFIYVSITIYAFDNVYAILPSTGILSKSIFPSDLYFLQCVDVYSGSMGYRQEHGNECRKLPY